MVQEGAPLALVGGCLEIGAVPRVVQEVSASGAEEGCHSQVVTATWMDMPAELTPIAPGSRQVAGKT